MTVWIQKKDNEIADDFIELLNINVEEFEQYKLGKLISTISKVI